MLKQFAHIIIGAVVRDLEKELAVLGYLNRPVYNIITMACVLRGDFDRTTKLCMKALDEYALADFVLPRIFRAKLFGLPIDASSRASVW